MAIKIPALRPLGRQRVCLTTHRTRDIDFPGVASYPWLDFSIGSDTGGSVRCPAGAQGIYGNRPSYGAVSLKRVMPLCNSMDTAGILAREAQLWRSVARVLYPEFQEYTAYPSRIVYPEEYFSIAVPGTPAGDLVNLFVLKLEQFLGTPKDVVNLPDLWESTKPSSEFSSFDVTFNKVRKLQSGTKGCRLIGE